MNSDEYTIQEHQHRLACWAASRSAAASPYCRFSVGIGNQLLKSLGMNEEWTLPNTIEEYERWHSKACVKLMELAAKRKDFNGRNKTSKQPKERFTYGVAAKLINCYIKVRFVHPANDCNSIDFVHPPVDRLLLNALFVHDQKDEKYKGLAPKWREFRDKGWSNFKEEDYLEVIKTIKERVNGEPLWTIERFWEGMQK